MLPQQQTRPYPHHSLTTAAWWPMPACSFRPPWCPAPGPAGTRPTITLTSADAPGRANTEGQDADAGRFRAGRRRLHRRRRCAARWWDGRCTLGCVVKAPSTLGTFLRSFRWGHVRQLDRVSRQLLARAWAAGAGPGDAPFTIDLDSTICETYGLAKEGAKGDCRHHGYTGARVRAAMVHPLLAIAAGTGFLRGADVPAARGPGQHRPWRRPLRMRELDVCELSRVIGELVPCDTGP